MKLTFRPLIAPDDWLKIQAVLPALWVEDTAGIVAIDENGILVGASLMDNWTHNSVQMHFMITSPLVLKHGFIEASFDIVFNEMNLNYVYGMVPGDNEKAIRLNKHMGFTEKMRLEEGWAVGVDYICMELKRENCRYLPVRKVA